MLSGFLLVLHRIDDLEILWLSDLTYWKVLHRIDDLEKKISGHAGMASVLHRIDDLENRWLSMFHL